MPKTSSYADRRQQGAVNLAPRLSLSLFSKVEKNQIHHHHHGSEGQAGLKLVLLATLPVLAREAVVHRRTLAAGVAKAVRTGRALLDRRLPGGSKRLAAPAVPPVGLPAGRDAEGDPRAPQPANADEHTA